jgi:hypothetical protein
MLTTPSPVGGARCFLSTTRALGGVSEHAREQERKHHGHDLRLEM